MAPEKEGDWNETGICSYVLEGYIKADDLKLSEEEQSLLSKLQEDRKNELKGMSVNEYLRTYLKRNQRRSKTQLRIIKMHDLI